jgi:hypothetical protein
VPILVLDELEGSAVPTERRDGVRAVRQHQRVIEHGGCRFEADIDFNRVSRGRLHRAERRRDEPRHGALFGQSIRNRDHRVAVAAIRHHDGHPARPDAAVARAGEQGQRRRPNHRTPRGAGDQKECASTQRQPVFGISD